MAANIVVMEDK